MSLARGHLERARRGPGQLRTTSAPRIGYLDVPDRVVWQKRSAGAEPDTDWPLEVRGRRRSQVRMRIRTFLDPRI